MSTIWPYRYFQRIEVECPDGCGGVPKEEFMRILEAIRGEAQFPFRISSGFRCEKYNARVAQSGPDSGHTKAVAVDILVFGSQALKIIELALKHGITGIGVSQKNDRARRFIHLDLVAPGNDLQPRPWIWSY